MGQFLEMSFAEKLRETRKKKCLTQAQVAENFGWTPMYYARYEKGQLLPTTNNYRKFTLFLNISKEKLLRLVDLDKESIKK